MISSATCRASGGFAPPGPGAPSPAGLSLPSPMRPPHEVMPMLAPPQGAVSRSGISADDSISRSNSPQKVRKILASPQKVREIADYSGVIRSPADQAKAQVRTQIQPER